MAIANLVVRISADIAAFERNIKAVERTLQRSGRNWESVGERMTKGFTLPLIASIGLASKAAIDFESSFAGVRKTVDATESQFKELEGQFRGLARTMPLSVNAINKVAESAGQLGVQRESLVAFTETMVQLGATTNLTADEAATSMAKFANAIGQPDIDIKKLGASLVALGNAGASTEKDILDLAGRIAGAGSQIGLSAGSIFGIANALSSVGIEAEKGGSAFSRLFNDLNAAVSKGGRDLQNFAEVARLSSAEFATLFKSDSAEAVTKFVEGLTAAKANGEDLLKVLDALGITELRYRDTVLLAANAGKQFASSVKLGNEAFGEGRALQDEYNKRLKTTESQLVLLKNNVHDAAITLGQAFLPVINDALTSAKPLVEIVSGLVKAFGELPAPIRNVSFALVGLVAAIGPISFAIGKLLQAWSGLLAAFRIAGAAVAVGSTALLGLVTVLTGVTTGVTGTTGALFLLTSSLAALVSPAALAVGALAAIVAVLPKASEGLRNMNAALSEGRFWEFVTTKDAPAIWEREFWGMGKGAEAAAKGLNTASESVQNLQRNISGQAIAQQVEDLRQAFAGLPPAVQQSADTMKRVGEQASLLRQQGGRLHPELAALADAFDKTKASAGGLNKPLVLAGKAIDQYAESVKSLRDELSGANLQSEVRKLQDAFKSLSDEQRRNPEILERVANAAEELRKRGALLTPQLRSLADQSRAFIEAQKNVEEVIQESARALDDMRRNTSDARLSQERLLGPLRESGQAWIDNAEAMDELNVSLAQLAREQAKTGGWFATVPDQAKKARFELSSLSKVLADIPQTLANAFVGGGDFLGAIQSIVTQIGAALGSAFGPIGTAIGSLAGGLVKHFQAAVQGIAKLPGWAKIVTAIAFPILGIPALFSNAGRDAVKEFAKSFGGFDKLRAKLSELGAEGERLWVKLTQGTGRSNPEQAAENIREVTAALDAFGTEAERAAKRFAGIGTAIEGVNHKAELFADPFRKLLESQKALKDNADADPLQLDAVNAKLAEMGQRGQAEFERIGIFAAAAFAGFVKESGDALGAIKALTPAFTVLQDGVKTFGLESTGTIDQLLRMFGLVNDAVTGPILQSIQATGQIFTGLQQGGLVTSQIFQTVATDIGNSFRELESKGGDVAGALALSQPILQRLWEGQQLYGEITDETTRKILDQAREQGLVGDHMKDVNQKILDVLIAIADVFGADIPESFRKTKDAARDAARVIEDELAGIKAPPEIRIPVGFDVGEIVLPNVSMDLDLPQLARGGIVRRPTLALIGEAGPEAVVPLSHMGTVAQPGSSTVILEVDGRMFAEVIVPHLPGAVRRRVHA